MWIVELSTPSQLEDEDLGFVKDGWTMVEIQIRLFDEREFDEEIRRISRPLDRVPRGWKEPDPRELMHVEGLSFNDVFLLRWPLTAEGGGEDRGIPYTFILNRYKYFATYEVSSAKDHHLRCVIICFSSLTVKSASSVSACERDSLKYQSVQSGRQRMARSVLVDDAPETCDVLGVCRFGTALTEAWVLICGTRA